MPFTPPLSKDLVELWETEVWVRPEIKAFTSLIYSADVTANQNTTNDLSLILDCDHVNFVQYFIQRYRRPGQVGQCQTFRYRVRIEYYRENFDPCVDQNKIQEFFEVLDDTVVDQLGPRWNDCVNEYSRQDNYPDIRRFRDIENRAIYVGSFEYFAEATAN